MVERQLTRTLHYQQQQDTGPHAMRRVGAGVDQQLNHRSHAQERERLLKRLAQAPKPEARGGGGAGGTGSTGAEPASPLQALLEHARALARVAHAEYHDGQAAHECTEEHTQ